MLLFCFSLNILMKVDTKELWQMAHKLPPLERKKTKIKMATAIMAIQANLIKITKNLTPAAIVEAIQMVSLTKTIKSHFSK